MSRRAVLDDGAGVEKGGWSQTESENLNKGPLKGECGNEQLCVRWGYAHWLCPSRGGGGNL